MSKSLKPGRTIVIPRPSRIRRDPVREEKEAIWRSREWEVRLSVAGVILFALAIAIIWVGAGIVTAGPGANEWEVKVKAGSE